MTRFNYQHSQQERLISIDALRVAALGVVLITPATVAFAWLFYQICEKPYIKKVSRKTQSVETRLDPVFASTIPPLADEG